MLDSFVSILGLMLGALFFVLLTRMVVLSQSSEPSAIDGNKHESLADDSESAVSNDSLSVLLDAQRFATGQLQDGYQNLDSLPDRLSEKDKQAVALYLIAAIEYMGSKKACSSKYKRMMVIKVLEAQLGFNAASISKYYTIAFSQNQTTTDKHYLRLGANAARKWLVNQTIPERFSISAQLNNTLDSASYA